MSTASTSKHKLTAKFGYESEFGYAYIDIHEICDDNSPSWLARIWSLGDYRYGIEFVKSPLPKTMEWVVVADSFTDATMHIIVLYNALDYLRESTNNPYATVNQLPTDVRKYLFAGERSKIVHDDKYLNIDRYSSKDLTWL